MTNLQTNSMKNSNFTAGAILVLLGLLLLMRNFGLLDINWDLVMNFWPLLLIYAGMAILNNNRKNWLMLLTMGLITILAVILYYLFKDQAGLDMV